MTEETSMYVNIDGTFIKEERVLEMAKQAGSILFAEHYLCPLLHHALLLKKDYLAEEVNKIRRHYALPPYATPCPTPASTNNMPQLIQKKKSPDDIAKEKYKKMDVKKRIEVVRRSLVLLILNDKTLFNSKSCWIGIYLVIKDRLIKMTQKDFKAFAEKCTPQDWEKNLMIVKSTMSNVGRKISYEDRQQAYYDMESNPFEELCEKFWSVLLNEILTVE